MICSQCKISGYNFFKSNGKVWCGVCEDSGTRTITLGMGGNVSGYSGRRGEGSIAGLPNLVSLTEWQEIIKLCRKVSKCKVLTEADPASDADFKPLPLPKIKNPLEAHPNDKREGWTPLDDYFKSLDKPVDRQSGYRNLFEG